MYDIRQFFPSLYLVVLLGFTGFALASESPPLWAFSAFALGVNAWLVKTRRFKPLPGWLAGAATLLGLGILYFVHFHLGVTDDPPLVFIGQFLVMLQIIKLYEQRGNRDYTQLLVLSLLLMVGASINTASLAFGLVLVIYLVAALYCCLIFHLKVEADRARLAFPIPPEKVNPATIQQDQRYLPRSMRRLTTLISVAAILTAAAVFLTFPRGAGQGVLGQLQFKPPTSLIGFSDHVAFDQINRIRQNDEVVARIVVWRDEKVVPGTEPLYLRGLTLDTYLPHPRGGRKPTWLRSQRRIEDARDITDDASLRTRLTSSGPSWRLRVQLRPTGSRFLFALQGLEQFRSARPVTVRYSPEDETLQVIQNEAASLALDYDVLCSNAPSRPDPLNALADQANLYFPHSDPAILEQVREFALRPEVTDGLAAKRFRLYPVQRSNEDIARKIEYYLRTKFTYTLDLTTRASDFRRGDPVVNFLTKVKSGHCEYFASAMALMCQSLGIPARIVVGFRCGGDSYNVVGQYYLVTQNCAHTWVEVLTPRGWVAFDPTSGREEESSHVAGLWRSARQFLDFLEYKWAESVVAYDVHDRANVVRMLDTALTKTAVNSSGNYFAFRRWLANLSQKNEFWNASSSILKWMVYLMAAAMVLVVLWYIIERQRLRRRAHRIGVDFLPPAQQVRLARQLAFFDQLMRVLHRRGIVRPAYLTPLEFASSLTFLPRESYDLIFRLTGLFYRVRFGDLDLSPIRQRHLHEVVRRLVATMDRVPRRAR
jgi:transglutaminase-like putative cysteine protease